jgi:hypothetical protein
MNYRGVLKKLKRNPAYALGRFSTVRRAYAGLQSAISPQRSSFRAGDRAFGLDASRAVRDLAEDGLAAGMQLPSEMVEEIRAFAESSTLVSSDFKRFTYADVEDGKLGEETIAMAHCVEPRDNASVRAISRNVVLRSICGAHLGYLPRREETRLFWSFANQLGDEERRKQNQTIDFHFDVHHYSFCYVRFYLTETNAESGAHVAVKGSHHRKPFNWLLGSARRTDGEIRGEYGESKVVRLDGPPGYGFVEDTSCYHKARAPTRADRLLLQFRWF